MTEPTRVTKQDKVQPDTGTRSIMRVRRSPERLADGLLTAVRSEREVL